MENTTYKDAHAVRCSDWAKDGPALTVRENKKQEERDALIAALDKMAHREQQCSYAGKEMAAAHNDVATNGVLPEPALSAAVDLETAVNDPTTSADDIADARKAFAEAMAEVMASDQQSSDPDADELEAVNGIGPAKAKKLNEAGIANLEALATITEEQAKALSIDQDWIDQAKALLTGK